MIRDPETLAQFLDTVNRFVRERLVPIEDLVAETDQIPEEVVREMKAMGLFGLTVPEEYGGLGLTMEEEVEVMFAMGQTSPCFRSLFGTTVGIGSQGIVFDGTPEQKAKYLPPLATGELVASFALTEPEAGSDAASLRTTAIRAGDHYVVNGTKRYITNAPQAGVFTLMARTDPANKSATRPASPSASRIARWASAARTPPTSSSRTAACRPRSSSAARKARASRPR